MTHERFKQKLTDFLFNVLMGVIVLAILFFALFLPVWASVEANRADLERTAEYIRERCR